MSDIPDTPTGAIFPKEMRMTSKKELDALFACGESFVAYPLRIVFGKTERKSPFGVSVLVSVSKKRFKRAVKRNRVKRLVRENFRLKHSLLIGVLADKPFALNVAFLYLKSELPTFGEISEAMDKTIDELCQRLSESAKKNEQTS